MIPCSLLLRSVRCFQRRNISKKQSVTDILRQTVLFKRIISNLLAFLIILFFYIIYFYFSSLLLQVRTCVRVFLFFFPHSRSHDVEENLRLHVSSERVSSSRGEGGTWVFFEWVYAARDSKLAPRSRWHRAWKASGTQGTELPTPWLNDNKKFCPVLFTFSSPWPPYDTERSLGRKENRSTQP